MFVVKPSLPRSGSPGPHILRSERGVVLILALVILVVLSMLAVFSLRNAGSSESVASNVRITELATQAAEIALRYCEDLAREDTNCKKSSGASCPPKPNEPPLFILPPSDPQNWQNTEHFWDSPSFAIRVVRLRLPNQPDKVIDPYKREPECMIEYLVPPTVGPVTYFVITARGFGPDVATLKDSDVHRRPVGSEIWLQSNIGMQFPPASAPATP